MEGENIETGLEFQMTKGELAEYCVNVTVKMEYGHKSCTWQYLECSFWQALEKECLWPSWERGWDIWGELCSAGVFLQAEYLLYRVFFCIGNAAGWDS